MQLVQDQLISLKKATDQIMESNSPLVSIIVPIYNVEKYLDKCLYSLVNQTYLNTEILAINDGSQDQSSQIVMDYQMQHKNLSLYTKSNGGLSDARNFGIEQAKGEFLLFVDSDDYVDVTMVEKLVKAALNHEAEIAVCDMEYVYETGQRKFSSGGKFKVGSVKEQNELFNINNSACNKLFKRRLFDDNRFIKGIWYEDLATIPKCCYEARRLVKVDEVLYFYFQRSNSIIHTENPKIFDIYLALSELKWYLLKNNDYNRFDNILKRMLIVQGIELTNLRIKSFDNHVVDYFITNHEKASAFFPYWYLDAYVWSSGFKKWVAFTLFYLKRFRLLSMLYKKTV